MHLHALRLRRGRGRAIAVVLATFLSLGATATAASADSDIETRLAYGAAPGQGISLPGMAVTNNGPDPAAGVTLAGTVPSADNEGHAVDWQIFANDATITEPFGGFMKVGTLTGPPFGVDPCTFTAGTDYRCDIGPLAVGETRTVVFNPTWTVPNTATSFTQWLGFSYTADLVGGTDPDPTNNDDNFDFVTNGFYYAQSMFGGTSDLQVVEQSPPASGAYAPGETVTLEITSTVPPNAAGGSVSVVVPDRDGVTCSGDGVCLTGGPQALTGPDRVLVAMAAPPLPGGGWPQAPITGDNVFTTVVSARLPAAAPAGCAPGERLPYTFDSTQQPTMGGSGLVSTAIIKLPLTVQIECPAPPPSDPPPTPPSTPPTPPVTTPAGHDVSVDKTVSSGRVVVGDTLTYTIVARNAGPGVAEHAVVTDTVPRHLRLQNVRTQQGDCSTRGNAITCALGTLAVGQRVEITVTTVATRAGNVTNTATIAAAGDDPPHNNVASARTQVRQPQLRVTKRASHRMIRIGQAVTYRIRVHNPSKQAVRRVRVCDQLPSDMLHVASKSKAKLSNGHYCWQIKRLGARQTKTFRIELRALPGAHGRKVNRVRVSSPDARGDRAASTVRVVGAPARAGGVTG